MTLPCPNTHQVLGKIVMYFSGNSELLWEGGGAAFMGRQSIWGAYQEMWTKAHKMILHDMITSMLVWWLICRAQGAPGDECLHYFPDSHFPLISWLLICDSADSENQNEKPWSRPWPGLGPTYSGRRVHWNMTTLRDSDTKHNEAILHSYILTLIVPSLIVMAVTGGIPHNCPEFPHKPW